MLDYMSGTNKMVYLYLVGVNKDEAIVIRCYQRYKYSFFEVGRSYRLSGVIVKGDTVWVVRGTTVGIRSPIQDCGTFPSHKLLLPEEHPPAGPKRSLSEALNTPLKSTIVGKILQVLYKVFVLISAQCA